MIRKSRDGQVIYLPPRAKDVPALMMALVEWINQSLSAEELPAPIVAALAHIQFATIHPYLDGNGRTARLLTTLILHQSGYGLKGIYNLEEYYTRNLQGYYQALAVGESHNYYEGRAEADVTGFVAFFCGGMADSFAAVCAQASKAATRGAVDPSGLLRRLDPRQRKVMELFQTQGTAATVEIAARLGLSPRTVAGLCRSWVEIGFLEIHDPSRKNRAYRLAPDFEDRLLRG